MVSKPLSRYWYVPVVFPIASALQVGHRILSLPFFTWNKTRDEQGFPLVIVKVDVHDQRVSLAIHAFDRDRPLWFGCQGSNFRTYTAQNTIGCIDVDDSPIFPIRVFNSLKPLELFEVFDGCQNLWSENIRSV